MKANELMVGDWVLVDNYPTQVKQVYQCGIISDLGEGDGKIEYFKPIPLTPEILEKNGFHINGIPNSITSIKGIDDWTDDWTDDTYVWSRQETPDERMFVSVYMDDPANFFVEVYCQYCHADGIHVKYIHELQRVFKICNIYKEIML